MLQFARRIQFAVYRGDPLKGRPALTTLQSKHTGGTNATPDPLENRRERNSKTKPDVAARSQ
jgi:hypothetical protein